MQVLPQITKAIGVILLLVVAVVAIRISQMGDHDNDRIVTETGDYAEAIPEDGVLVVDLVSPRAWNAQIDRVVLSVGEESAHRLPVETAWDGTGNAYDRCGMWECIWVEFDCSTEQCQSRTVFPIPEEFIGAQGVSWEIVTTIEVELDLTIHAAVDRLSALGFPSSWEPPRTDMAVGRDSIKIYPSEPHTFARIRFDLPNTYGSSELSLFIAAHASDHPDLDLLVFDEAGNRIDAGPVPNPASTERDRINDLFEHGAASLYVMLPENPAEDEELVVELIAVHPLGKPTDVNPTVVLTRVLPGALPFDLDPPPEGGG